ncbi:translation elongation factor 4 [Patescibacteria group bacterium]|nr:translation elongation factor 4 [Patescibacteria group bacterium]MBU1868064.1 translation elongation factor 4 [Patescibacteria group bacterium]
MESQKFIRNFSIIAHIDHGKSTLADRILEITNTIPQREMRVRYLDKLDLEQERGVTIKLQPIRIEYTPPTKLSFKDPQSLALEDTNYILNLIDTPGHVDFSYEVSRSLAACEGAVLLVDLAQGVQAQTLAHYQKAKDLSLRLIPVINKIDLNVDSTAEEQLINLGFTKDEFIYTSGKTGEGTRSLLQAIINRVPHPTGQESGPLRALVFDSFYDPHKGVVLLVKVVDGKIAKLGSSFQKLRLIASNIIFSPTECGYLKANLLPQNQLLTGEVGYLATGIKDIKLCRPGDTVTNIEAEMSNIKALPGYKEIKPRVFAGIYPAKASQINELRDALNKLSLNDAALTYKPESSPALGSGFRIGCLGQFHLEISQERLHREFNTEVIPTTPTVEYQILLVNGNLITVTSVDELPDSSRINEIREPWIKAMIITPQEYLGAIMQICQNSRGQQQHAENIGQMNNERLRLTYHLPLSELLEGFFDKLKSATSGFASFDYEIIDFRKGDIVKLDFLVNKEIVTPLSLLVPRQHAEAKGRAIVDKLKNLVPRQQFSIPIQAAIGNKVVARADLRAFRKDVTAKLYGGDRTRKDKLLRQQKKGKKKMKQFGKVTLPPEVYKNLNKS